MQNPDDTVWQAVTQALKEKGIDLDSACCEGQFNRVRVVCVAPDLSETLTEMGEEVRDHVVMVRLDRETTRTLDRWVESGVVRSRSEAAALFIREGLKVRSKELDRLMDAIEEVEQAKTRLREKARGILGAHD